MQMIDHSSPVPLHAQVESLLRDLIARPEYQSGRPLPKEVELSKRLGIARNTLRQATSKLVYEGLLIRKKGVGTFAAPKNVITRLEKWSSFSQEMTQQGHEFHNYSIYSGFVEADAEVAAALGVETGKSVFRLERLRGCEQEPFVLFVSYFHPRVGLNGAEDFTRPLYEILENDCHTIPMVSREEISACAADKTLAAQLKIPAGSPILFRRRKVLDPGDRVIEYNLCYYRADKFSYSIDIKRSIG